MATRPKSAALDADGVISAAVAGLSHKAIARRFACSPAAVQAVLDQYAQEMLRPGNRATMLALEVSRLEQLQATFLKQAIEQLDATAGTLCVKISQRIAALCGLDQPAMIRLDITQAIEHQDETSTQRMLEAIRRLRSEPEAGTSDDQSEVTSAKDQAIANG